MFCGMDKVARSVLSSSFFLYHVVFSVMSVQYCLCVGRIQCTQCQVQCQSTERRLRFYSVQSKKCSASVQFLKQSSG